MIKNQVVLADTKLKLRLNIDKTKIMRFRKKGGRKREWIGRWKGVKIEEVKEFKYLGYT